MLHRRSPLRPKRWRGAFGLALTPLLLAACITASPSRPASTSPSSPGDAGPTPSATGRDPSRPAGGWPRAVQTSRGTVEVRQPPQRIHTLSVGYDEITFALVDPSRIAAVGAASVNPAWSNVAHLAARVPKQVGRDAEQVLAAKPDLVVASPFAKADLVEALEQAGVPVVVADLVNSVEGHEANIRFLATLYGEEERGERLVQEVRERLARVDSVVSQKSESERPRALMLIGSAFTPGGGSNEGGLILRAGGVNLAAEAGIKGNKQLSLEVIPGMDPDIVLLVDEEPSQARLEGTLLSHPALKELRALKERRYYPLRHSFVTTLSHWNVVGVEQLTRIFYPLEFSPEPPGPGSPFWRAQG